MKKFKKVLVGLFAILLAVVATACSNKSNSSKDGYTPKSLTIQFVPSQAANKLEKCFLKSSEFQFMFQCQLTTTQLLKQ